MKEKIEARRIRQGPFRVEFEIRMVMRRQISFEEKAKIICELTDWDLKKLIRVMKKYGTYGTNKRSYIISKFWPERKK